MSDFVWPSKKKKERLRAEGITAASDFIIYSAFLAGYLSGLLLQYANLKKDFSALLSALSKDLSGIYQAVTQIIFDFLVFPLLLAIFSAFLVILLQNKFLFRIGFNKNKKDFSVLRLFCRLCMIISLSLLIVVYSWRNFTDIFALIQPNQFIFLENLARILKNKMQVMLLFVLFLIPVIYLFSWFLFNLRHRMSPAEQAEESDERGELVRGI